jgi:hypothetical protein
VIRMPNAVPHLTPGLGALDTLHSVAPSLAAVELERPDPCRPVDTRSCNRLTILLRLLVALKPRGRFLGLGKERHHDKLGSGEKNGR